MRNAIFCILLLVLAGCTAPQHDMSQVMAEGNPDAYAVSIATIPAQPAPGQNATLRVSIAHADHSPVNFELMHERLLHVMLIRDDLQHFAHIHAQDDAGGAASGTFVLSHTFTKPGTYRVMAEFMEDGKDIVKPVDLIVPGEYAKIPLGSDFSRTKTFDGYTVALNGPDAIMPGMMSMFTVDVSRDGKPLNGELENYLGEKTHLAVWQEGLQHFEHAHPVTMNGQLMLHAFFPTHGLYKFYPQFKHDGTVVTAEFLVNVG